MRQAKENKLFLVLSSHLQRKEKLLKVQHILKVSLQNSVYTIIATTFLFPTTKDTANTLYKQSNGQSVD